MPSCVWENMSLKYQYCTILLISSTFITVLSHFKGRVSELGDWWRWYELEVKYDIMRMFLWQEKVITFLWKDEY